MNLQASLSGRSYGQLPIFVEDHEFVVGVKKAGAGEGAILPRDLSVIDVDRGEESGAGDATRTINPIAHPHRVAEMDFDSVAHPDLRSRGLTSATGESDHSAACAVSRRHKHQPVRRVPHGRADAQSEVGLRGMAPEQGAVGRVRAVYFVLAAMNYLILPADVDDHRRGRRGREIDVLPNDGAR